MTAAMASVGIDGGFYERRSADANLEKQMECE